MTGLIAGLITYNPEPLERPPRGTCSYAVPSQTRVSLWIFERRSLTEDLLEKIFERTGRSRIMLSDIVSGGIFPDYELSDHTCKPCELSDLHGDDPLILTTSL
jgi:hypothetical protein